MDTDETYSEKARREQHKNATCYFEQILEAALHKKKKTHTLVRPPTSHLTKYPSKTNNKCWTLLKK